MPDTLSLPDLLDFRHVFVMRGERLALHGLTLRIPAGEHVAILGPNGCGKSTLIKTITRDLYPLLRPETDLRIWGERRWRLFDLRAIMGIVSNDLVAACTREDTGREIVLSGFFGSIGLLAKPTVTEEMERRTDEVLDLLEVTHLADRPLEELSSGEARRLVIGRALVHRPRALLLDEPSNRLDLRAQQELRTAMRRLAASGVQLILVTHHLDDLIPEIQRVVLLRDGTVLADGPAEAMLTSEQMTELFQVPVTVRREGGRVSLLWA